MKIAIVNGPNLNLTGKRLREVYGTTSMEQVMTNIQREWGNVRFHYFQSNHEGDLIDEIQTLALSEDKWDGIVLNAGGYTHTSVALRDAVSFAIEQQVPVIEVHISDITQREAFRRVSLLSDVVTHSIIGHGIDGYREAVAYFLQREP